MVKQIFAKSNALQASMTFPECKFEAITPQFNNLNGKWAGWSAAVAVVKSNLKTMEESNSRTKATATNEKQYNSNKDKIQVLNLPFPSHPQKSIDYIMAVQEVIFSSVFGQHLAQWDPSQWLKILGAATI